MTELTLTEKERQVVLGVLEAKQRQLQFETRRTESFQMHDELREDLRAVDRLIERLQNAERMTRLPAGDVGGSFAG